MAFEKWEPLARRGNALAQFNLELMCDIGESAPDYKRAIKGCELATGNNNELTQFKLGNLFEKCKGVVKSDKEALKWYRRSEQSRKAENERSPLSTLR